MPSRLFYDLTKYLASASCCVGLVGIDVHSQSVLRAYTNNYIAEYQTSALGINLYGYNILILYAELFSIFRSCMDMTLCCDYAFLQLNLACRSYQLTCAAACNIAGSCGIAEGFFHADDSVCA